MDAKQIIRYIDNGANNYLRLFGHAVHMEYVNNGFYCYVKPKNGEQGISFVFDIRLENLPMEDKQKKIEEIQSLNMPVWLDLLAPSDLHKLMFGKDKEHEKTVLEDYDEAYMALLPHELIAYEPKDADITVVKVETEEQFKSWAKLANDLFGGGQPDMHPVYHYLLVQKGLMQCYIGFKNDIPVAVSAIMDDKGIASLEFVATIPEIRRQGFAKAVCTKAINDALENGSEIITLRAIGLGTIKLYESLGFRIYNFAL